MSIDDAMQNIYPEWRYRWCEAKTCYCMGCVNISGRLNYSKKDWLDWKLRHPPDDHKTQVKNTKLQPLPLDPSLIAELESED